MDTARHGTAIPIANNGSTASQTKEQKAMTTTRRFRLPLLIWSTLLLLLILTGACVPPDFESAALGTVVVGPGDVIHIRSLGALTSAGDLGVPSQRGVALAVADYGPIKGHNVTMGAGLDSLCTPEGGAAAADGDRRPARRRRHRHLLLGRGCGRLSHPQRGRSGDDLPHQYRPCADL